MINESSPVVDKFHASCKTVEYLYMQPLYVSHGANESVIPRRVVLAVVMSKFVRSRI